MRKAAIVGIGLIGRAWANVFARAGWQVSLWDANPDALQQAPKQIEDTLEDLAAHGLIDNVGDAAARITIAASMSDCVGDVDLVQESGPERVDIKKEIYKELDALTNPEAVIASSSSGIIASAFTEDLPGRSRCLIGHPVNPPHLVPIVEICGAPWTSQEAIEKAWEIYDSVGQVPVTIKKEIDGFVLNRLQAVLLSESMRLIGDGYVSAEDLDKTIAHGLGLRWAFMGPIETIELNAPGGIADYCKRYGPTLYNASKEPVTEALWADHNIARVLESWGRTPTPEGIASKSRWRDNRLAALAVHKKSQEDYEG